jgi:hypothetical protein
MPTNVNSWTRLEPFARSQSLKEGLRAGVYDPLWLLARQWQLREFVGSDVGTPVLAALRMDCTPVTRYLAGSLPDSWFAGPPGTPAPNPVAAGSQLRRAEPLETLIEREPVRGDSTRYPSLAAEAGLHLLRLLDPTGASGYRAALVSGFPLPSAPADASLPPDDDTERFLGVVAPRVPDGALLASVIRVARSATALNTLTDPFKARVAAAVPKWQTWLAGVPAADRPRVDAAIATWLDWFDSLFNELDAAQPASAWLPDRLEYAAAVAAPAQEGEILLTVPEYTDGDLDWYSFDVLPRGTLGATRGDLASWPWLDPERETVRRTVIPAPVRYPGMPASAYWEFEDSRIDFGAVAAGPQQLAHLLLVEFALVYGDDWFIIPVDVPVGSLARVRWLVVTDTFAGRTLVPSAREVDRQANTDPKEPLPWDMFGLAIDRRPVGGAARPVPDAFFLPPTLGKSLQGPLLEDVLLLRDEMANMAWAVERVVESPLGRPFDRAEAYHRARQEEPNGTPALDDGAVTLRYRLETEVPDHWLPLYPERVSAAAPAIRFLVGNLPLGRMLRPPRPLDQDPLRIQDEEVPREGARVTRAYQYARWVDGRTYLWLGRRKGTGRGEGSSGLRFDVLEVEP